MHAISTRRVSEGQWCLFPTRRVSEGQWEVPRSRVGLGCAEAGPSLTRRVGIGTVNIYVFRSSNISRHFRESLDQPFQFFP